MEQVKQHYQDRLDQLHQFLYCDLPLKMMNDDDDNIDLQEKLYNLVEKGYIKQMEERQQLLLDEIAELRQQSNQENGGDKYNVLLIDQLNLEKQKLSIENKLQKKQIIELETNMENLEIEKENLMNKLAEKDNLIFEIEEKLQNYQILSEGLMKAEKALTDLAEENMNLNQQIQNLLEEKQIYENQLSEIQQHMKTQEESQIQEDQDLKQNIQILEKEFHQWEDKKSKLIHTVKSIQSYMKDQLKQHRIELNGLLAECKIRTQIMEQFQAQLKSDLVKGFNSILVKTKTELQQQVQKVKECSNQQIEEQNDQIIKLQKNLSFYKVLEEEYEQKLNEALNTKDVCASKLQLKEKQLNDIMIKLDTVQENIQKTEDYYLNQIGEIENQRDRTTYNYRQFKNMTKLKLINIQKQLSLIQENYTEFILKITQKIQTLEEKIHLENKKLVEGLGQELEKSVEKIKQQFYQIRELETELAKIKINQKTYEIPQLTNIPQVPFIQNQEIRQKSFERTTTSTQRSSLGLDEQRKYLNTLKEIHRNTKSQLKHQR